MDAGNLTHAEAQARSRRVATHGYRLVLELDSDGYSGQVVAEFDVLPGEGRLWLDFSGGELLALSFDGEARGPEAWSEHRVWLDELAPGRHEVSLSYRNSYDSTGVGFHRFVDPADDAVVVYSDFQPFNAHRLFPCFDQPDLKATYEVEVVAPASWVVISSGVETSRRLESNGRTRHQFGRTPPFSTYLLAVIAGELQEWRSEARGIPLRLFARRSLAPHVDAQEVLELTARGLAFYEDAFGVPYPFGKYDQVFVPEFNAGAMENVAAVTLGEHMVFRGQVSPGDRLGRAETVLHELAHMWFGNLVTMRWWDDLWLNEGFATFVSHLALDDDPTVSGTWEGFRAKIKSWAHRQDELSTTHAVACAVPDTAATFLNFDGITYGKGAAALKQLYAYIGADAFGRGLRAYFARHAWGNTSLRDFLVALEEASGRSLQDWSRAWIESSGVARLTPLLEVEGGVLTSFSIQQDPTSEGVYPSHQLQVALLGGEPLTVEVTVPVLVEGALVEVPELRGRPLPRLVLIDHGDWTYAKLSLDPLSLEFARTELEQLPDPLGRVQLWEALWQMVRDQRLSTLEFLELVERRLGHESQSEIVDAVLEHCRVALALYLSDANREEAQDRHVRMAWQQLEQASSPELRLVWLRQTVATVRAPRDLGRLVQLADGLETLPEVSLDQPLRWDLLVRLSAFAYPGVASRLAAERQRDPSDTGVKSALAVEASAPELEVKQRLWVAFTNGEGQLNDDAVKAGMARFHWPHQRELLRPFVARFFAEAPVVAGRGNQELTQSLFRCLFPPYPEPEVLEQARVFLEQAPTPELRRMAAEALCELERAAACRQYQEGLLARLERGGR